MGEGEGCRVGRGMSESEVGRRGGSWMLEVKVGVGSDGGWE